MIYIAGNNTINYLERNDIHGAFITRKTQFNLEYIKNTNIYTDID